MTGNYEQKYKSALEWMRSIYPTMQGAEKEDAEHYFPELRESEDEKIAKELIRYLPYCDDIAKDTKERWIAWLEKKGEKFWSEEDEHYKNGLIGLIEDSKAGLPINFKGKAADKCIDWLKSIKPNHWKPSATQMSMLLAVLNDPNNISSESVQIALKSLYNNLKTL